MFSGSIDIGMAFHLYEFSYVIEGQQITRMLYNKTCNRKFFFYMSFQMDPKITRLFKHFTTILPDTGISFPYYEYIQ